MRPRIDPRGTVLPTSTRTGPSAIVVVLVPHAKDSSRRDPGYSQCGASPANHVPRKASDLSESRRRPKALLGCHWTIPDETAQADKTTKTPNAARSQPKPLPTVLPPRSSKWYVSLEDLLPQPLTRASQSISSQIYRSVYQSPSTISMRNANKTSTSTWKWSLLTIIVPL